MLKGLLRLLAWLPLPAVHAFGCVFGWVIFLASPRYAARTKENLARCGLEGGLYRTALRRTVSEAGKSIAELLVVWLRPQKNLIGLVREKVGWEKVEAARQTGKGIIFLTPHLGCFEISALYYGAHGPLTVLYRPPRKAWLEPLMVDGRSRGLVSLAPADRKGVRALLTALRRGEAVGILPDQVPSQGEGVWADFFGRPAYTMTLVARLQQATGAAILLAFAERLPWGRGYRLWIEEMPEALPDDKIAAVSAVNRGIESLIRRNPAQYLWSYNRYKVPRGVTPPEPGS